MNHCQIDANAPTPENGADTPPLPGYSGTTAFISAGNRNRTFPSSTPAAPPAGFTAGFVSARNSPRRPRNRSVNHPLPRRSSGTPSGKAVIRSPFAP